MSSKTATTRLDTGGIVYGLVASGLLTFLVVVGSRRLEHFDPALVGYLFATLFAIFGITYRYAVWLKRPPTRLYWRRGWEVFFQPRKWLRNLALFPQVFWDNIVAQRFIERRSRRRWWMHLCLSGGCATAAAVTFPLVFGWIHFESDPSDQMIYQMHVFGFLVGRFPIRTLWSWLIFHVLDFSAILVLIGIALAVHRRVRDRGELATQQFSNDFVPLVMLFAISITGLMLTASTLWMRGRLYGFLGLTHEITVIFTLLYLPFGKFFHIFQRPAQLGVTFYRREGREGKLAGCHRCGETYASRLHVQDLKTVLDELGFDFRMPHPVEHYQEICPACRRKLLALNHSELYGGTFTR